MINIAFKNSLISFLIILLNFTKTFSYGLDDEDIFNFRESPWEKDLLMEIEGGAHPATEDPRHFQHMAPEIYCESKEEIAGGNVNNLLNLFEENDLYIETNESFRQYIEQFVQEPITLDFLMQAMAQHSNHDMILQCLGMLETPGLYFPKEVTDAQEKVSYYFSKFPEKAHKKALRLIFNPTEAEKGVRILEKLCERKFYPAFKDLGVCYAEGIGLRQDYNKAVSLFIEGANKGQKGCAYSLAICLIEGKGVKKDPEGARRILEVLSNVGEQKACLKMAKILMGSQSLMDKVKSKNYLEKGAEAGCEECKKLLSDEDYKKNYLTYCLRIAKMLWESESLSDKVRSRVYFDKGEKSGCNECKKHLEDEGYVVTWGVYYRIYIQSLKGKESA